MTKTKECADGILKDENPRMRAWFGSMDTVMYNASGQILQGTIQLLLVLSVGIFSALAGTKLTKIFVSIRFEQVSAGPSEDSL